jgi:pyruvate dehydrogenase E1 component
MAFTRLLRNLCRDPSSAAGGADHPRRGPHLRHGRAVPEFKIYASQGQKYEPVDHDLLLSYTESQDGQILEEGITEAGSMASFIAAGTSYATRGVPMVPFFIFYSMFGFQRVGDLIWQAADARARGFLLGATAGRTTLLGEGLQHQDGHSLCWPPPTRPCEAYDPAFAYEVATIVRHGLHRMYGPEDDDVFYYLTLYNENYEMPPMPDLEGAERAIIEGLYRGPTPEGPSKRRPPSCSRAPPTGRRPRGAPTSWPSTTTSAPSCGRPPATRSCARRPWRPSAGTASTRPAEPRTRWSPSCWPTAPGPSWPSPTS